MGLNETLPFGHRIVEPTAVSNIRFLGPDDVPAQTTTFRQGDTARLKIGRVVLRVGYAKIPADYHERARNLLHTRTDLPGPPMADWTTSGSVMEILQARSRTPFRNRQIERRLVDAVAYGLAHADRFGGPTRGVVVGDRPDLVGREFTVFDVRRHQLGTRYSGGGGPDDYEPPGLDGRRTIVTVDIGVSMRPGKPWNGFRALTGDIELVSRG